MEIDQSVDNYNTLDINKIIDEDAKGDNLLPSSLTEEEIEAKKTIKEKVPKYNDFIIPILKLFQEYKVLQPKTIKDILYKKSSYLWEEVYNFPSNSWWNLIIERIGFALSYTNLLKLTEKDKKTKLLSLTEKWKKLLQEGKQNMSLQDISKDEDFILHQKEASLKKKEKELKEKLEAEELLKKELEQQKENENKNELQKNDSISSTLMDKEKEEIIKQENNDNIKFEKKNNKDTQDKTMDDFLEIIFNVEEQLDEIFDSLNNNEKDLLFQEMIKKLGYPYIILDSQDENNYFYYVAKNMLWLDKEMLVISLNNSIKQNEYSIVLSKQQIIKLCMYHF